jgi:phytoene desaturase
MKKAIVIGAGIGGLGTAIQLAKKGFKVKIYEKNSAPGGRCGIIKKDGHVFDTGPTMFLYPEIYRNFYSLIGEDMNQHINLLKVDPTYFLHFANGDSLVLTSDLKNMRRQLEKIEPGSYLKYLKYLDAAKMHYKISIENVIYKNIKKPWHYFNINNLFLILKSGALLNHHYFTSKFFKNENLKAAFTFQDSYLSLNPYNSPSIFSQFAYMETVKGSYLPEGGMYKVIESLVKIASKNGVKIKLNSPVSKVLINGGKAEGIKLSSGKIIKADLVIVNADLTNAYVNLLPESSKARNLPTKPHSCSTVTFHWGLKKTYPKLKTHNLFFADSYKQAFDYVLNSILPPGKPHFYIQAPSRTDTSRAPKNQDTFSVMVPINHLSPEVLIDWKQYSRVLKKYIILRLEKAGLKDIGKNIKFEICHTPPDWQTHLNLAHGSVYGHHHGISQLGYLREKRIHNKYSNIYFVGASNHPGSGLPTVLVSSQFTAMDILSDLT